MDTSQTPTPDSRPQSDRDKAELLYQLAEHAYGHIGYEDRTAAELADRTPGERLADAQLLMLQAIYHELRHGHDQAAAQTMALADHSTALNEHASALDSASHRMAGHADALDRFR
ncbi:hypothetical protein ACSDR0_47875 [Streptosporangium sp. G11]|uniref:hypothetical protein n=1 Tax=Streptosporangium sp. G11 TaxID=3436926 RepID=UPI003EBC4604